MKVAVYSTKPYDKKYLEAYNTKGHELLFWEEALSLDTVALSKGVQAVSVFTNDDCSSVVLESLKVLGIKYLAIRAAGYDQVDVSFAKQSEMEVARVPQYSPYAIAEHAVTMMLALNRKIVQADKKVKSYNFLLDDLIGFDLHGKTVGIIGCGKIGSIVAKIMHGFGCSLLIYDVFQNEALIREYNAKYCDLNTLYAESDVITVHTPLNAETKHMIGKEAIDKMKKGVMLINTGRGAVLHTKAVLEGLESGKIGYLGMDVYEFEKPLFFKDHSKEIPSDALFAQLLSYNNVLITGHQAFLTENALKNIAQTTIDSIDAWSTGAASPTAL
jgi:D-lactate dehydrogenase